MNSPDSPAQLIGKAIAAYIRISSDRQDAERQRKTIAEWAERNGLTIGEWFEDTEGRNPRDKADDRMSFQRLLRLVETGEVDAVVVDSQDRFGAYSNWELGKYIWKLIQNDCSLWSVADGCLSAEDDGTVIRTTVSQQTSLKEQKEKGWRAIGAKVKSAQEGLYPGGYPPYGLDVVCLSAGNKKDVKWRVVWIGDHERIKIFRDGKEERYSGKNNMPAKDEHDVFVYQPSIVEERIKYLRLMFEWYAHEDISPSRIATRLNELGVSSVFGEGWNKQKVKSTLMNPAAIGMPAYNKNAHGRFWEYIDGERKEVVRVGGKAKTGRRRKSKDFVFPKKPVFDPIVEVELFNSVQGKLAQNSRAYKEKVPKPRAPKTAQFWLRNTVVCATCNKPMRAWNQESGEKKYRSYFCANYGTYGKNNPTGCRSNRVKAEVLEELIDKYIAESHAQVSKLIAALDEESLEEVGPLHDAWKKTWEEIREIWRRRNRFVNRIEKQMSPEEFLQEEASLLPDDDDGPAGTLPVVTTDQLYEHFYSQRKPLMEQQLAELDAKHSQLVSSLSNFDPKAKIAIEKLNREIVEVEKQMVALKGDLEDLDEQGRLLSSELRHRKTVLESMKEKFSSEQTYRRKSSLVKEVIERAVCHFEDTEGKGNQPRTRLVRVEVFPVDGAPTSCFPKGTSPATG